MNKLTRDDIEALLTMADNMSKKEKKSFLKAVREFEEEEAVMAKVGSGYDEFWNTKKRYRVLKGGRGSKKSVTTALWYIWNIMKHPKANVVVVRKTGNTNKDSTWAQLRWAARHLGVFDKWDFKVSPLEAVYLPTGQKILFRGFDDPLKLTSMTVDVGVLCWAWCEEAYELDSAEDFDTFDESIRGEMPDGLWKQITLTYNPWVNNHWTKERYWDNEHPNTFRLTTTHKCNEFLDQADHDKIEALQHTDPDRYKVVGLGEYGIPGGAYFDEFRTDIHVIEPFVIPKEWRRYRVLDYGLDMLACYWIATDSQNKAYVYKELYKSGLIISDAAKAIKEMTLADENIYQTLAPPDLWNRRQETGKSAAELFRDNGVQLHRANNNRIQGWYNLKEWLKPYSDEQGIKTASLVIFKNCNNIIRCLPQIQRDEKDPNDTANEPHEITHSCITGDTIINTPNGDFKIIDLINTEGDVYCYDEEKKIKTKSKYFDVRMTQKNAPIYKITLEDGRTIKCTSDHKILTQSGWKEALHLAEGDDIIDISL